MSFVQSIEFVSLVTGTRVFDRRKIFLAVCFKIYSLFLVAKLHFNFYCSRGTKGLKNQPCDVIKMREMIGEVVKKTPKKEIDNYSFL